MTPVRKPDNTEVIKMRIGSDVKAEIEKIAEKKSGRLHNNVDCF